VKSFEQWTFEQLLESVGTARYSVEVNFRTSLPEILDSFAKIALGYVSAVLKKQPEDYHVKHVFEQKPFRILVSTGNWREGEWVGVVSYHSEARKFMVSRGYYKRDTNTVAVEETQECPGQSAADIARHLINYMHQLKRTPDQHRPEMKPVPLKRGPK
jgi:hypothetical protein